MNIFRWAELYHLARICTFKEYVDYNYKIVIRLTFVWFLITFMVWFIIGD